MEQAPNTTPETPEQSPDAQASPDPAAELVAAKNEAKEKEQKYLYLYAEFENFKKRVAKERSDLVKFGWEPLAAELVGVVDNLERAVAHIPPTTDKNLAMGVTMVLNQLLSTVQKQGLQPIESLNKDFDPNLHEAVGEEESLEAPGTVIREHAKGYLLHGRLLRPARVVLSKAPTVAT